MTDPIEIVLSPKTTVQIRELDGWTSQAAEAMAAGLIGNTKELAAKFGIVVSRAYAVGSIVTINGRAVDPLKNELEYRSVSQSMTFAEMNVLVNKFADIFPDRQGDDSEKEFAAELSPD